jgi:hypothetical protein
VENLPCYHGEKNDAKATIDVVSVDHGFWLSLVVSCQAVVCSASGPPESRFSWYKNYVESTKTIPVFSPMQNKHDCCFSDIIITHPLTRIVQ